MPGDATRGFRNLKMHFVLSLVFLGVSLAAGRSLAGNRGYGGYGDTDNFVCANTTCDSDPAVNSCYCGPLKTFTPEPLKYYHEPKRYGYGDKDDGLCEEQFAGYWCDNLDFFKNQKEKSGYGHSKKCSKTVTSIDDALNKTADGDTSCLYSGVLKIKKKGTYSFELTCSDGCVLLLGGKAVVTSPQIKIVGDRINKTTCDNSIKLKRGYYKVQIAHGISGSILGGEQKEIQFKWGKKGSTLTTELTSFFPEKKHKRGGYGRRHFGNNGDGDGDGDGDRHFGNENHQSGYGDHGNGYGDSHSSKSYNDHGLASHDPRVKIVYATKNRHGKGDRSSHSSKSYNDDDHGKDHDDHRGYSYNEHNRNSYGDHDSNSYGDYDRNSYNEHNENSYGLADHDPRIEIVYKKKTRSHRPDHNYRPRHNRGRSRYGSNHDSYDSKQNSYDSKHDSYGSKQNSYGSKSSSRYHSRKKKKKKKTSTSTTTSTTTTTGPTTGPT